jgi:hypothetical protein
MSGTELAPGQPEAAGPSSAVVAAPATDGAVDLTVHPSGIVPQLQCVPLLPSPKIRPLSFFRRSSRAPVEHTPDARTPQRTGTSSRP